MQTLHITSGLTPTTTRTPTRRAFTPHFDHQLSLNDAGISTSPSRRGECAPLTAMAVQLEHGGHAQEPGDDRVFCDGYEVCCVMCSA